LPLVFLFFFLLFLAPVDEMGSRIDELEKSIGTLMEQAGIEEEDEKGASGSK